MILLLTVSLWSVENKFTIENTNFTIEQASAFPALTDEASYLYNYDRLRLKDILTWNSFYLTAIADVVNYVGDDFVNSLDFKYIELLRADTPFDTRTNFYHYDSGTIYAKLHRFYAGYQDDHHNIIVGLQKISMGVGRIWVPTDLYNPKNSFAREPDEVFPVLALTYAYSPSDLSVIRAIVSMRRDKTYKYALSYKAFLDIADFGLNVIYSDDTQMYGYEVEGDLFDTGAEWRSEGGYYISKPLDSEFYQAILGADYGFKNGITWTVEGYYSSETFTYEQIILYFQNDIVNNMVQSNFYLGTSLTYDFNIAFNGSVMLIESFNEDNSLFIVPAITYTLNDNNILILSAMINSGSDQSEFGRFGNTYFFNWKWSY
ncbi:MAG: hypothetical protein U9Q90_09195 [Campylobacterota bacterium]|nr:hypothetical protein [Campylobacterota bacterium]